MLKRILTFLLFGVLLFSFVGCGDFGDVPSDTSSESDTEKSLFKFSYHDEYTVWERGEGKLGEEYRQYPLVTTIEYLGEESYAYQSDRKFLGNGERDSCPSIVIYSNEDGSLELTEHSYRMVSSSSNADASSEKQQEILPGEVAVSCAHLEVPKDAPVGKYHLELSFLGHSQVFENAIEIVDSLDSFQGEKPGSYPFKLSFYDDYAVWKRSACKNGEEYYWQAFVTAIEYIGEEPYVYNTSGAFYGTTPAFAIYYNEDGSTELTEQSYQLTRGNISAIPSEPVGQTIQPGEFTVNSDFVKIPKDAPLGKYHIKLSFEGYYQIFENAIEIVE